MNKQSNHTSRAARYVGQFLTDMAESITLAHEARETMNKPDRYFESRGTTRNTTIRRIFEI